MQGGQAHGKALKMKALPDGGSWQYCHTALQRRIVRAATCGRTPMLRARVARARRGARDASLSFGSRSCNDAVDGIHHTLGAGCQSSGPVEETSRHTDSPMRNMAIRTWTLARSQYFIFHPRLRTCKFAAGRPCPLYRRNRAFHLVLLVVTLMMSIWSSKSRCMPPMMNGGEHVKL